MPSKQEVTKNTPPQVHHYTTMKRSIVFSHHFISSKENVIKFLLEQFSCFRYATAVNWKTFLKKEFHRIRT